MKPAHQVQWLPLYSCSGSESESPVLRTGVIWKIGVGWWVTNRSGWLLELLTELTTRIQLPKSILYVLDIALQFPSWGLLIHKPFADLQLCIHFDLGFCKPLNYESGNGRNAYLNHVAGNCGTKGIIGIRHRYHRQTQIKTLWRQATQQIWRGWLLQHINHKAAFFILHPIGSLNRTPK